MHEPKTIKPSVLLQLDTDPQPSVFDAVVAVDSGVDHVLRHGNVRVEAVRNLVHGLLFTRGADELQRSALFIGGSDIRAGESILDAVSATFFGPFRVAVLLDSNGANTTAAAVVLAVEQSLGSAPDWNQTAVAVLGAGSVGRRVARLLTGLGAKVRIGSPDRNQAHEATQSLRVKDLAPVESFEIHPGWQPQIAHSTVIVAAGPAGVEILPGLNREQWPDLRVAVDLNAVPPQGLGGTKPTDRDKDRNGVRVWGALGVGGLKMKIHKAAIRALFDGEPSVLDVEQVFELGRKVVTSGS